MVKFRNYYDNDLNIDKQQAYNDGGGGGMALCQINH